MLFTLPQKLFSFSRYLSFCLWFEFLSWWESKGNQTMKFGQLIECKMRHIFLETSYTTCDGERRTFPGKLKFSVYLDQYSKVLYSLFSLYATLRAVETCWNYAEDHFLLPHVKPFFKIKRGLRLVSLPHFLHNFWRKVFLLLYFINWQRYWVIFVM